MNLMFRKLNKCINPKLMLTIKFTTTVDNFLHLLILFLIFALNWKNK